MNFRSFLGFLLAILLLSAPVMAGQKTFLSSSIFYPAGKRCTELNLACGGKN